MGAGAEDGFWLSEVRRYIRFIFFSDISSYFLLFQKPHFFRFSENGVLEKITFSFLAPPPDLTSELGLSSNNFLGALPSSWEHLAAHPPPPLTCLRSSDRSICFQSGSNKTFGSEESRGLVWWLGVTPEITQLMLQGWILPSASGPSERAATSLPPGPAAWNQQKYPFLVRFGTILNTEPPSCPGCAHVASSTQWFKPLSSTIHCFKHPLGLRQFVKFWGWGCVSWVFSIPR